MTKAEISQAELTSYLALNTLELEPGDHHHLICVDGRYTRDLHERQDIAAPGAHLGPIMALLDPRFSLSPREAFELVLGFLDSTQTAFCWHTDTHEGHDGCVIGCGHCNAAIKHASRYGLEAGRVEEMVAMVRAYQAERGPTADQEMSDASCPECTLLTLDHQERAVLVVESERFTVEHCGENERGELEQYFVYDALLYRQFLERLVEYAAGRGYQLDLGQLLKVVEHQTNTTLSLLQSSQGLEIFQVSFTEQGVPTTKLLGRVEAAV